MAGVADGSCALTIFARLSPEPADGNMAAGAAYAADSRPEKANLVIGVYYDAEGRIPVLESVAEAERRLAARGAPWAYLGSEGLPALRSAARELVFGERLVRGLGARIATVQTLGGTGALRLGADLLHRSSPGVEAVISCPTWSNHRGVFEAAGLRVTEYPYYDAATRGLDFDAMRSALAALRPGTIVVLHACCHNPTGVDPTPEQWEALADLMAERGLVPFLDMAYAGFGDGLERDSASVRLLAGRGLPLLVATSFSKSFSLYGERVGVLSVIAGTAAEGELVTAQLRGLARTSYSAPPAHGALLVTTVLTDPELRTLWEGELEAMRRRIAAMRTTLLERVGASNRHDFTPLIQQKGLFSFSGLDPSQMARLRAEFAVHATDDGRLCVSALNAGNMDRVAAGLRAVTAT